MKVEYLIPLPVVLPLLAAGVKFIIGPRGNRLQGLISVVVTIVTLLTEIALLFAADDRDGPLVLTLGGFSPGVGITMVADRLSAMMLVITSTVVLCILIYSIGQGAVDQGASGPLTVYHPTFLILVAGVSDAFLAGDLFNMFVGFEILLVASYVLITMGGTGPRIRSGATYVIVGMLSSLSFLVSVAMIYAATGTVNMAQLAVRIALLPPDVALVLHVMLITAFAVKAAVFPLSMWLPDSYPTAPAPVTAAFAGLLTKVGVYAIIRAQTLLFPGDRLGLLLMVGAFLTMIVGILGAIVQADLRRMLSFTLVSHIGYMIFGVALGTVDGMSGAIFYAFHHITVQATLFLVTGLIERRGGSTNLGRLGGLARVSPLIGVVYLVPALNLAGIPPMSGFLGKLGLLQAGAIMGTPAAYVLLGAAIATSLLTLYAVSRAWGAAFWRRPRGPVAEPGTVVSSPGPEEHAARSPELRTDTTGLGESSVTAARFPRLMLGSTIALVVMSLAFTPFAGPLIAYADRAATESLRQDAYIHAVFPGIGR
ncbi:Na+/H+ antiporter subunit D [Bailinhaonella thermotolerans]|uniref:Na+/H+ antiporter subunit D n=1 Tax=Bailinhaonella thermotolerans TaxID=1070861 RepID=UPI00192A26B3|nr:Na+/H+ antiporter subunit D [Bailinhaonella thermotolerans]